MHRRPILLQSKLKSVSSPEHYLSESPQACLLSHTLQNTPSDIKTARKAISPAAKPLYVATAAALSVRPQ